jgi:hypothetical protein
MLDLGEARWLHDYHIGCEHRIGVLGPVCRRLAFSLPTRCRPLTTHAMSWQDIASHGLDIHVR